MQEFPWTYDQFQRYSVLKACAEVLFPENSPQVLDVGGKASNRRGDGCWLPGCNAAAKDAYAVDISFCLDTRFIQGDGCKLPFKDNSFDLVSCLDVLEHIENADREDLLQELCRVSRDVVLLANPFKDKEIEKAEQVVFDQVKTLAGVEHKQLLEHKNYGLPEKAVVSEILANNISSGAEFSFGSLENWLLSLSLKYSFWYKADKEKIHEFLDKFMIRRFNALEFEPPFYRHYWLYSHNKERSYLAAKVKDVKTKLRDYLPGESNLKEIIKFNRDLVRVFNPESVSAVIVTYDKGVNFDKCLNHLLTQNVDFNLQVAVLDLSKSQDLKYQLKAFFPGVLYLSHGEDDAVNINMLKAAAGLKGDYVLLLSEDVFLPSDSVQSFYDKLKAAEGYDLLSPRVIDDEGAEQVKFWTNRKQRKRWKRKGKTYRHEAAQKPFQWIESECLFFKKSAIFGQENKYPLKGENIFLWGSDNHLLEVVYFDEFVVNKKC